MNNLIREKNQNQKVFRELFFSSQKKLSARFDELKKNFKCKRCCSCCKNRYLEVSPEEIEKLAKTSKKWAKFKDFFVIKDANTEFTTKIKSKLQTEVWFYECKFFDGEACTYKGPKEHFCQNQSVNIEKILPDECAYIDWQKAVLNAIENEIFKDILIKYKQVEAYKENFTCNRTGTCCKFACSEFSYEELKEKASHGDRFATQFISVFIPYDDQEEAKKIYPEYVDMLEKKLGQDEKVYFYHCPHLDENNLCTQYDKRPDICREFPNNALSILPPWCGYYQWKEDTEVLAMTLHALLSISEFYKEKLEQVI
jgi:Fe-S-cluster containining protein